MTRDHGLTKCFKRSSRESNKGQVIPHTHLDGVYLCVKRHTSLFRNRNHGKLSVGSKHDRIYIACLYKPREALKLC